MIKRRKSRKSKKPVRKTPNLSAGRINRFDQARRSKSPLPGTACVISRTTIKRPRRGFAEVNMTMTELQFMAKSRGVPFGGLSKGRLVKKLNEYY